MNLLHKTTALLLIGAMAAGFTACSSDETEDPVAIGGQTTISSEGNGGGNDQSAADSYKFTYSGATLTVNTDVAPVLSALGSDYSYFDSDSCAYQGKDKIYTYTHFAIYTYPDGDRDMISSVEFKSDIVATEEGIRIGMTKDDVVAAYGSDYQEVSNVIKYTKGDSVLSFVLTDDEVTGIVYDYADLRTE